MGVIGTALTAGLVGSGLLLFPTLMFASRPPRGRRVRSNRALSSRNLALALLTVFVACVAGLTLIAGGADESAGLAVAVTALAVAMAFATRTPKPSGARRAVPAPRTRIVPKRRAAQPSLAARVVLPTTAAAGTGAAIVLVTAGTASAPSAGPRADDPLVLSISAHQTLAAQPHQHKKAASLVRQLSVREAADQKSPVGGLAPAATPTPEPVVPLAPPTSEPGTPTASATATPSPSPSNPDLIDAVDDLVGGLVGGLLKP